MNDLKNSHKNELLFAETKTKVKYHRIINQLNEEYLRSILYYFKNLESQLEDAQDVLNSMSLEMEELKSSSVSEKTTLRNELERLQVKTSVISSSVFFSIKVFLESITQS